MKKIFVINDCDGNPYAGFENKMDAHNYCVLKDFDKERFCVCAVELYENFADMNSQS